MSLRFTPLRGWLGLPCRLSIRLQQLGHFPQEFRPRDRSNKHRLHIFSLNEPKRQQPRHYDHTIGLSKRINQILGRMAKLAPKYHPVLTSLVGPNGTKHVFKRAHKLCSGGSEPPMTSYPRWSSLELECQQLQLLVQLRPTLFFLLANTSRC
jgi:hypothetical protein